MECAKLYSVSKMENRLRVKDLVNEIKCKKLSQFIT